MARSSSASSTVWGTPPVCQGLRRFGRGEWGYDHPFYLALTVPDTTRDGGLPSSHRRAPGAAAPGLPLRPRTGLVLKRRTGWTVPTRVATPRAALRTAPPRGRRP